MQNARFGRRRYAHAIEDEVGGDEGETSNNRRQIMVNRARKQGAELQREAVRKKFFFQQKLVLEGKRKQIGKGNIVTFLLSNAKHGIEMNEVNKILRIGGFTPDQVLALKINDFRTNQVEVLFKGDVSIDTMKVEEKLRKGELDIIVSKFDHAEEF